MNKLTIKVKEIKGNCVVYKGGERLCGIAGGLNIYDRYELSVVFPEHPRTTKIIEKFNVKLNENIKLVKPLGFFEFLQLEASAKLVLTDSGGVQEETFILKVPCVTRRDNTERPETIDVGSNVLAGCDPDAIFNKVSLMINKNKSWKNPFGDGKSGEKIIKKMKSWKYDS